MAYYSGTATSLSTLRDALLAHAQADGWVLTGSVLSKAGVYFGIGLATNHITLRGYEDNAGLNPSPNNVMIGRLYEYSTYPIRELTFPCNYEVFGFAQELYFVVNYNTDSYQWMAFGKSTVPGLPGQGGWVGATLGSIPASQSDGAVYEPILIEAAGVNDIEAGGNYTATSAMLFTSRQGYAATNSNNTCRNCWVNTGLDGHGWLPYTSGTVDAYWPGIMAMSQLLWCQPSAWNGEAALLPLRCWKPRPSFKSSLVVDCENARQLRIDNFTPGSILTLGTDKWKVFPWYRKDSVQRNGLLNARINHSGTFGWAIRYEGL